MPFYEYILDAESSDAGCEYCRARFTILQKISDAPISVCPKCNSPVRRIISPPYVVSGKAHQLQEKNIEKAGFTQYKKIGKGVYEKTAGKGPSIISDD